MGVTCAANEPVSWSDWHAIASAIDGAADSLNTPGYTALTADQNYPFIFSDTVGAPSLSIHYDVSPRKDSGPLVATSYLKLGNQPFDFQGMPNANFLRNLAQSGQLYLVVEQSACICKSVFQFKRGVGGPWFIDQVQDANATGCCQSVPVPQVGDTLGAGQNIIPSGYAKSWQSNHFMAKGGISGEERVQACTKGDTTVFGFTLKRSSSFGGFYDMIYAERVLMPGKLVWKILASYMDAWWGRLLEIIDCDNHSGAMPMSVFYSGAEPEDPEDPFDTGYIPPGCCPSLEDLLWTFLKDGEGNEEPGCITEYRTTSVLPWNGLTCGAAGVCGSLIPTYCNTLEQMEAFAQFVATVLNEYEEETSGAACCVKLDCDLVVSEEGGNAGFYEHYDLTAGETLPSGCQAIVGEASVKLTVSYEMMQVPDEITLDDVTSGCVSGSGKLEKSYDFWSEVNDGKKITISVRADCEDRGSTKWSFSTICVIKSNETGSDLAP